MNSHESVVRQSQHWPNEPVYCRHPSCQCAHAANLALMSDILGRTDLLAMAIDIHRGNAEVRCFQIPRRGHHGTAILAPLPEDKR